MYPRFAFDRAAAACVRPRATSRAFTLLELLTVVAIIALLAAFLFPVLATVRDRGRQISCLSQVRQIGHAHQLYIQDWDDRFPNWWQPAPPGELGPFVYWPSMLGQAEKQGICRDPAASEESLLPPETKLADYALLTWGPNGSGTREDPYWCWPHSRLTLASVVRPTETATVVDGITTTEETRVLDRARHGTGLNAAFLDGHARWMTPDRLFEIVVDPSGFVRYRYASADR